MNDNIDTNTTELADTEGHRFTGIVTPYGEPDDTEGHGGRFPAPDDTEAHAAGTKQ